MSQQRLELVARGIWVLAGAVFAVLVIEILLVVNLMADTNQMADSNQIPVVGSGGYKPSPNETQRVQTFLKWLPVKTKPSAIVIIPSKDFADVAKKFGSSDTNVAFQLGGRAYINQDAFSPSQDMVDKLSQSIQAPPFENQKTFGSKLNQGNLVEWAIGHEVGHMNSNLDPKLQEQRDYLQNEAANEDVTNYNNPQGKAYQGLQSQVAARQGQIQPTSAPIETELHSCSAASFTVSCLAGSPEAWRSESKK